jgi:lysophospholipase L1-like esterase
VPATLLAVASSFACGKTTPVQPTPTPPALSCPAGITISGAVSGGQTVTYTAPVPAGGAAPVSTSCAPASGASFPVGNTPVTCTAVDALSRQASCSFSVTIDPLRLRILRFVAFGDSVTAGEDGRRLHIRVGFVDPVRSYPAVLQSLMSVDFPEQGATVINEGLGGRRARDDVERLPGVLEIYKPEGLLILHGYNDLLNEGLEAVDSVVFALRDQIRSARTRGVSNVFVSTLTPSRPWTRTPGLANREIDPRAIEALNGRLAQMTPGEGGILVDTHAAFKGRELELIGDDGLHLTVTGNRVLADTFYSAIRAAGLAANAPGLRAPTFRFLSAPGR